MSEAGPSGHANRPSTFSIESIPDAPDAPTQYPDHNLPQKEQLAKVLEWIN